MLTLAAGLSAAVAVPLVLLTRPWGKSARRAPLPWVLAAAMAGFMVWFGVAAYADAVDQGLWTSASVTVGFAWVFAVGYGVLGYVLGRVLAGTLDAVNGPRRIGPMSLRAAAAVGLTALAVTWIGGDIMKWRVMTLSQEARRADLSPHEIAVLAAQVASGETRGDVALTFLENPLCPPDLLHRFAGGTPRERVAVARNPAAPAELLAVLSRDRDAEVRWQAAANTHMPPDDLGRLAADPHATVRSTAAWQHGLPDEAFRRLLADTDVQVRATAARQPRQTDDELRRMLADPEPSVRAAARFIAAQRAWD